MSLIMLFSFMVSPSFVTMYVSSWNKSSLLDVYFILKASVFRVSSFLFVIFMMFCGLYTASAFSFGRSMATANLPPMS